MEDSKSTKNGMEVTQQNHTVHDRWAFFGVTGGLTTQTTLATEHDVDPLPDVHLETRWERYLASMHGLHTSSKLTAERYADVDRYERDTLGPVLYREDPHDPCNYLLIEEHKCITDHFKSGVGCLSDVRSSTEWAQCKWDDEKFQRGYNFIEPRPSMTFILKKLPWAENALAPKISAETIAYHYGKHHGGYVKRLNEIVKGTHWEGKELIDIIRGGEGVLFNQAAQVYNHDIYWQSLSPNGGGAPYGEIKGLIEDHFDSFNAFKTEFSNAAANHFGSGWAWLCLEGCTGKLFVTHTSDAQTPASCPDTLPLLTCDVWEHAYYIDYRNDRKLYIDTWWDLVNWELPNKLLKTVDNYLNLNKGC